MLDQDFNYSEYLADFYLYTHIYFFSNWDDGIQIFDLLEPKAYLFVSEIITGVVAAMFSPAPKLKSEVFLALKLTQAQELFTCRKWKCI